MPPALAKLLQRTARAAAAMKEQLEQEEEEIEADAPPAPVGVGALTAGTLEREVLYWKRFPSGKKLGSFAGICPSEDSSGTCRRQDSIDKHGNPRRRFWCQEAVWRLYKFQPGYKSVVWARGQLIKANQSRAKQVAVAPGPTLPGGLVAGAHRPHRRLRARSDIQGGIRRVSLRPLPLLVP